MSQTIICDFDGVWVDSFAALYRINDAAATAFGLRLTAAQYGDAFNGPIHRELARLLQLDAARHHEFSEYKRRIFSEHYNPRTVQFFPFAESLMKALPQFGRLHIVTASPVEAVEALLEQSGLRSHFDEVAGFSLAGKRATLERLVAQAPQDPAVFVTDTVGDVREAAGLRLDVFGVGWGFHHPADLLAAGARGVARDSAELAAQIEAAAVCSH